MLWSSTSGMCFFLRSIFVITWVREQMITNNVQNMTAKSLFIWGTTWCWNKFPFVNKQPVNASQKQDHTDNFGHCVISDLLKKFYYNRKLDGLSVLFPALFKTCPKACLAMACTCISIPLMFFFSLEACSGGMRHVTFAVVIVIKR